MFDNLSQNLDEIEEAWLDTQLSGVSMEELSKAWLQAEAEIETEVRWDVSLLFNIFFKWTVVLLR